MNQLRSFRGAAICFLFLGLTLFVPDTWADTKLTFDMLHTVQNCKHDPHPSTWCDNNDINASSNDSGIDKRLIDQFDRTAANPSKSRIFVSEFSFSNKNIQRKLCSLGKLGVSIEVYLDHGSAGDASFAAATDCQKDPAHPNLKAYLLGGFTNYPDWRLHHNKTVIVDAGDGTPFDIAFSSGNLSTFGTSLHLENWVFVKSPADANFSRATLCLFQGLASANVEAVANGMYANGGADFSKDPAVMKAYQNSRDACYKTSKVIPMSDPEKAVAQEQVAAFFTPNSGQQAMVTLQREFQKVTAQNASAPAYIYIAIEHFSLQEFADVLNEAAKKGVDVRIIMNSGTVDGGSEVGEDGPFYQNNLKGGKIKVRFIETNSAVHQQMHNKFAILNGKRIFSGAGHYTYTGMDSNFETLYLIENGDLNKQYARYFKQLWETSVDESHLTAGTPNTAPVALGAEFLKLAQ